ncbi:talin rod domain-containing protein 1-like [Littorina saxatilis]|uniref:Talin IBS2B domain-containing protein n=1 Tax=Littorina saxatilis TaxID=31220 RepID=A0AAN9G643_9CAEN
MVVVASAVVMSRHNGREVVMLCEECHSKMLAVGELLLLSCEARPVFTAQTDLELSRETFLHYRDRVIDKLNHILMASRDIASQAHSGAVQWKAFTARLQELGGLVVALTELSAHIAYLMAVNFERSQTSALGVVNKYKLHQAQLDLKFCCSRLKRSCVDDLDTHLLVDLCSTISRALSSMTEVCRYASENAREVDDQNQFKLCIKSITSTTSCLISSVKRFKSSPSIDHLRRIIAFCDPVVATSSALVTFASEEEFVGMPAKLSDKATEAHKSVLGMTMSIVSASIQMCKAIRDLVYDLSNSRHKERIRLCVDSVDKASSKLRDLLLSCDFEPKTGSGPTKTGSPERQTGSPERKTDSPERKTGSSNADNVSANARVSSPDGVDGSAERETGSPDAKTGSDDAKSSSGSPDVAAVLSGMTASSPSLNLSVSSMGSISDLERDIGVSD